jgi:hypothetical protein
MLERTADWTIDKFMIYSCRSFGGAGDGRATR